MDKKKDKLKHITVQLNKTHANIEQKGCKSKKIDFFQSSSSFIHRGLNERSQKRGFLRVWSKKNTQCIRECQNKKLKRAQSLFLGKENSLELFNKENKNMSSTLNIEMDRSVHFDPSSPKKQCKLRESIKLQGRKRQFSEMIPSSYFIRMQFEDANEDEDLATSPFLR